MSTILPLGGAPAAGPAAAPAADPAAGFPATLPAYAHNDYLNDRPLQDALDGGFRGVEADYFLVDGELLVAHDIEDLRPGRTLEALYLRPLRERIDRLGCVQPGEPVFYLNIESKREGPETYDALHDVLSTYEDILTTVRDGEVISGPVQVILVGWFPPLADLAAQPVRYAAVQSHFKELPADHASYPAHLLKLITVKYRDEFAWNGCPPRPGEFTWRLHEVRQARNAVPGRVLRVFAVPGSAEVCAALLAGGMDLIGTKDLQKTGRVLLDLESAPTPAGR
ncbi:MAG: hypothetical protein AB7V45_00140 [Candidatus Krumholzibacteriia bacterium]